MTTAADTDVDDLDVLLILRAVLRLCNDRRLLEESELIYKAERILSARVLVPRP
jgi:hypothetical protein